MPTRAESDARPASGNGPASAERPLSDCFAAADLREDRSSISVDSPAIPAKANQELSTRLIVFFLAALLCGLWSSISYFRWANYAYRTFDLAYYVQATWQLIHGRLAVTVENVPLLGNHVEPIVFLFAPIFAVVRHPMVFVFVQNAALASMGPIGYRLARQFFDARSAALFALALLLSPAAGYVALHEFHPEALTAPLLLLMIYSRTIRRLWLYWLCFAGVLACKENMALLLATYCLVFLFIERRNGSTELLRWDGGPLILALLWFALCAKVITPAFNSGNIDYLSLYDRLGKNGADILWNAVTRPQLIGGALIQSLTHGNLIWGLLVPFLGLPLLRPRWLLIAAPVLLQHLLSWRSSEWTIYFHYAAPLLPLFWIAAVEAAAMLRDRWKSAASIEEGAPIENARPRFVTAAAGMVVIACLVAQLWVGPARTMGTELLNQSDDRAARSHKQAFIQKIPADASVVAPLPYLSHLAMREKLYSLHYILKGLKTLGRQRYESPAPPEFALIDYSDSATFDAGAGYYHPQMRTADGQIIPSSDRLLHEFLAQTAWSVDSHNELVLFTRTKSNESEDIAAARTENNSPRFTVPGSALLWIDQSQPRSRGGNAEVDMQLRWEVHAARQIFPWMIVRLTNVDRSRSAIFTRGLCAIQKSSGVVEEHWTMDVSNLPPGAYAAEAIFADNSKRSWAQAHGDTDAKAGFLAPPIPLGTVRLPGAAP